jgi:Ca2+-binding EF-hand superfamily protein
LEKAILEYYSHHLISKEEMLIIRSKFEELDINCDGRISYKELKKLFDSHKISGSLKKTFKILDTDGNRYITYDEFVLALVDRDNLKIEGNIKKCFKALDISNKKKLSLGELESQIGTETFCGDPKDFRLSFYASSLGKNYVNLTR